MNIKEVKKELALTDTDIAEFFQYKNRIAYATSTSKPRIENGIVKIYYGYTGDARRKVARELNCEKCGMSVHDEASEELSEEAMWR